MARAAPADLATIAARRRLRPARKPYWRAIEAGLHVGAYIGRDVRWAARRYVGGQRYEETALGLAEDTNRPADGVTVLTFDQAQERAREWRRACEAPPEAPTLPLPTVGAVVAAYVAERRKRADRAGRDAAWRTAKHLPKDDPLHALPIDRLDAAAIRKWRKRRIADLAPATANRLLNDLRAALNDAGRTHRTRLPASFGDAVRDGLRGEEDAATPRPAQILSDEEVRRIVDAAYQVDADLGALVLVLAATGARFSMVARLTVADFQPAHSRIMLPASRKGRGTKKRAHIAVPLPADVIARLRPLADGRTGRVPLLMRWHHRQERKPGMPPTWVRDHRAAWRVAADMARGWREARTLAGLPADVVPYTLRHWSIVRGLRAGLPVRLVAAVHDTSAAMIERHYSAFIVDATADLLRAATISLAPPADPAGKVIAMDAARAG